MTLPQITYTDAGGPQVLAFTYPPVQKPGAFASSRELTAVRADSTTTGGTRQSILQRIDEFITLQLDFVPMADLLDAWSNFMSFALQGGQFYYYPDATDTGTFDLFELADTDWNPAYNFRTVAKFKIKMRKVVS